jgi:flagellar biosynthesis/type III secretory pathway chaperone
LSPELKIVIYEERKSLNNILKLLDEQYDYIIKKDIIQMDKVAKKLEEASKELAKLEIQRRKITGKDVKMKELIETCDDENVKSAYKEIRGTLRMLELQKQANSTLLKNQLFFTKKMINLLKPSNEVNVYDSYGKVGK